MDCPQCQAVMADDTNRCERCGAELPQERESSGAADVPHDIPPESHEPSGPGEATERQEDRGFLLDREFDRLYARFKREEGFRQEDTFEQKPPEPAAEREPEVQRGGFARRAWAMAIDFALLLVLTTLLLYFSSVGYRVGMAAHGQTVADGLAPLFAIARFGFFFLAAIYFIVFHGMDGRTVGKWIMGLRVVGAGQEPVTYAQAFVRSVGYLLSSVFFIGFLWVLFHREKRGWHDLLAGTWVIRESSYRGES